MRKIGKFEYPNRCSFKDVLKIAEAAIKKYGGVIPYKAAAEELGYKIKHPAAISGYIYKRFDDICMFGLTTRERKVMRITSLAEKALDPTDPERAAEGKAEAIRKIQIIARAFDEWNGEIPSETAFPAKIAKLANVSWIEAEKHVESLRKLFIETFPYLRAVPRPLKEIEEEREEMSEEIVSPPPSPWLEGRVGNVYIRIPRSKRGLETAEKLLELMRMQILEEEEEAEENFSKPE
jgi:hypothetical protein